MKTARAHGLLRLAAVLEIVATLLMIWGCLDDRPIVLVIAMTVGQGLGGLAFAAFLMVVIADLRHSQVFLALARRFSSRPPPGGAGPAGS